MTSRIPDVLRLEVTLRAGYRCEYCRIHQNDRLFAHEIDHVIAEKHGGQTQSANLSLACAECNRFKGTDICSFDGVSETIVSLFNPRSQRWTDHFRVTEGVIEGLTANSRVTVKLLQFNRVETIERRRSLMKQGRYPD